MLACWIINDYVWNVKILNSEVKNIEYFNN